LDGAEPDTLIVPEKEVQARRRKLAATGMLALPEMEVPVQRRTDAVLGILVLLEREARSRRTKRAATDLLVRPDLGSTTHSSMTCDHAVGIGLDILLGFLPPWKRSASETRNPHHRVSTVHSPLESRPRSLLGIAYRFVTSPELVASDFRDCSVFLRAL
jgi:hypothetical protein